MYLEDRFFKTDLIWWTRALLQRKRVAVHQIKSHIKQVKNEKCNLNHCFCNDIH